MWAQKGVIKSNHKHLKNGEITCFNRLHLALLFWNHVFTWKELKKDEYINVKSHSFFLKNFF